MGIGGVSGFYLLETTSERDLDWVSTGAAFILVG